MGDSLGTIVLKVWEMAQANPWIWPVLILLGAPFILWWWNMLRRQWSESGINLSAVRGILTRLRRGSVRPTVTTPSPKSGREFKLWKELLLWPIITLPMILIPAFFAKEPFSVQWWAAISYFELTIGVIFGLPIYGSVILEYFNMKKAISGACDYLTGKNIGDEEAKMTYLDVFIALGDDLRMGLDPRVIPLVCPCGVQNTTFPILSEFMHVHLIKPDSKTKQNTLAHRYYLTRVGATLITKLKTSSNKEKAHNKE